ncbi:helix-turn-helix domain-containing protein [Microbacterium sp. LWO14-1.2]|uniref:helix-turn-helix domain-containing protein n=1 Tax=Microbacterium sp. LWO14-1.2 TaxID=3135263 RepID=UPI0031399427
METIENRIRQIIREELQPLIETLRGVAEVLRDTSQPSQTATYDASHRAAATGPSARRDSSRGSPGERDGWLTPVEAAALLRVSEKTLANWRASQRGPAFRKVGRVVRYARTDVESYPTSRANLPRSTHG